MRLSDHGCYHPGFSGLQSTDDPDMWYRSIRRVRECIGELPPHSSLGCSYSNYFHDLGIAKPGPEVYSRGLFCTETSCLYRKADGCCLGARFQTFSTLTRPAQSHSSNRGQVCLLASETRPQPVVFADAKMTGKPKPPRSKPADSRKVWKTRTSCFPEGPSARLPGSRGHLGSRRMLQ